MKTTQHRLQARLGPTPQATSLSEKATNVLYWLIKKKEFITTVTFNLLQYATNKLYLSRSSVFTFATEKSAAVGYNNIFSWQQELYRAVGVQFNN